MFGYAQPGLTIPSMGYCATESRSPVRSSASSALSYGMLLLFLLFLYVQPAILVPALETFRPVYAIGGAAILLFCFDRVMSWRGLLFAWPDNFFMLGFLGAVALSCLGAFWQYFAALGCLELLKITGLYFLLSQIIDSESRLRGAVTTMVIGGLVPAIGTLTLYSQGVLREGRAHWHGFFANSNDLACGMVILLPLAVGLAGMVRGWKRMALWLIVLLFIAATLVSFSRGGILGLYTVLGVIGFAQRNRHVRLLSLVLFAASLLFVFYWWSRDDGFTNLDADRNLQERVETYRAGLAMAIDHPLLGVGISCSVVAWPLYAPGNIRIRKSLAIHNTFLEILSETGLFGFSFYLLLLGSVFYSARHVLRLCSGTDNAGLVQLTTALATSFLGFLVCAFSGPYALSWFPYILMALVACAKTMSEWRYEYVR